MNERNGSVGKVMERILKFKYIEIEFKGEFKGEKKV